MTGWIIADDANICKITRKSYARAYRSVSDRYILECRSIDDLRTLQKAMINETGFCSVAKSVDNYSGSYLFDALFYHQGKDGRMMWYDAMAGRLINFIALQMKKRIDAERNGQYKWEKINNEHCYISTKEDLIIKLRMTQKSLRGALQTLIKNDVIFITYYQHKVTFNKKSMQIFLNWPALYYLLSQLFNNCSEHPIFEKPLRSLEKKDPMKFVFYRDILLTALRAYRPYQGKVDRSSDLKQKFQQSKSPTRFFPL